MHEEVLGGAGANLGGPTAGFFANGYEQQAGDTAAQSQPQSYETVGGTGSHSYGSGTSTTANILNSGAKFDPINFTFAQNNSTRGIIEVREPEPRELEKEEELYMMLIDIMRSPEMIKSICGSSLKQKKD